MVNRISQEKARIISQNLTKTKLNQAKDKFSQFCKNLEKDVTESLIPQDVVDFNMKYPDLIEHLGNYGITVVKDKRETFGFLSFPNLPNIWYKDGKRNYTSLKEFLKEPERLKLITSAIVEFDDARQECETLKNQVYCILIKLSTYKKIKEQYPEAYQELLALDEKWGISNPDSPEPKDLCTSVESVRAQLK